MSHNYLFDIRQYIDDRLKAVKCELEATSLSGEERRKAEGRLAALTAFRRFMCDTYYPRLPRRLYRKLAAEECGSVSDPAAGYVPDGHCGIGTAVADGCAPHRE